MATSNGVNGDFNPAVRAVDAFIASNPNVKLVHMQYVDISGTLRSRLVPIKSFRRTIETDGVHPASATIFDMCFPADNSIQPASLPYIIKKGKLKPDPSSLRRTRDSANLGNTAMCFGELHEMLDLDPRVLLRKTVSKAQTQHGLEFLVGHELEFCFIEKDGKLSMPDDAQKGVHISDVMVRSRFWPILNEVVVALAEEGIQVIECHKEFDPAQFEIALPPMSPVESVDACYFARELIRDVAYRHGLCVSFGPAPLPDNETRNGAHVHISATSVDDRKFICDEFMGGLVSHLPSLCALGMASIDSYTRVKTEAFGAGGLVAWGTNNRSTPIRKCGENHWEIRCNDGTSNVYLMVAGIIAAGLDAQPVITKDIDSKYLVDVS